VIKMMLRRKIICVAAGGLVVALAAGTLASAPAAYAAAPNNDSVAHPRVISAVPTTIHQNTKGATHASTDPGRVYGASVWYQFKPAAAVTARIVTIGSSYCSALAVFHGRAINANRIAASAYRFDYSCAAGVLVSFQAGVRYLIAVSNANGRGGGPMTLTLYQPRKPHVDAAVSNAAAGQISGKLFVSGTVGCNNPSDVYVYVEVDQRVGDHVVYGASEMALTSAALDQEQTWTTAIYSQTGWAFATDQPAAVYVYADMWDGWRYVYMESNSNITITAGPEGSTP
jgi:hypothetical protein